MPGNANFDTLMSTTLKNYRKKLEDNVFFSTPLLAFLNARGNKEMLDGGETIVVPLMYGRNSTAGSYNGYDVLDTTPQAGLTAAEYNWRQVAASIAISRREERQNSGESQILNLLKAKIQQAELSLQERVEQMLFSDGTGNGGKDILGLEAIVDSAGTVGGIARATETWWSAKETALSANLSLPAMAAMYNDTSRGHSSDHPDLILTTKDGFEAYEALLTPQMRFTDTKMGDLGFQNLKYKGAVVMYSDYCPAGTMYFINSKYLKLIVDTQTDLVTTDFVRPSDQDAKVAQILWMGQLVASNCARQGKITTISNA